MAVNKNKAKTEYLPYDLTLIPKLALLSLGAFFKAQKQSSKYGDGNENWKKALFDKEWQLERANHALAHLLEFTELLSNNQQYTPSALEHLTKAAWYCLVEIDLIFNEDMQQNRDDQK